MVSCSVLTVNIGVVLAKTEESFGNLRLKIYLCHIIHLFSYQYAMKKILTPDLCYIDSFICCLG